MGLPVATEWFAVDDQGDDIARLTEPHVRALIRSNVYVVTSKGQALIIDTGCGIVPLRPYLPPVRTRPRPSPRTATSITSAGCTSSRRA